MKKKIFAVLCAALIICLGVVSAFAISPPIPSVSPVVVFSGQGNLTEVDAVAAYEYVKCLYDLGYFQFGNLVIVGRRSDSLTVRLATSITSGALPDISVDSSSITVNPNLQEYSFTTQGISRYSIRSSVDIYALSDVICYIDESGNLVNNLSNYSYGTATSAAFQATVTEWKEFYDKVYYYDENLADAEAQGRAEGLEEGYLEGEADGYHDGYDVGKSIGYQEGYETGLAEGLERGEEIGYSDGYAQGKEDGKTEGIAQGREEGYETGYAEGEADGYSQGQSEGYASGLQTGRAEGYETGYADGLEDGYETGYADGLEDGYETGYDDGLEAGTGSGGSERVEPVMCYFVYSGSDDWYYFYWDGSDVSTLSTYRLDEQPEGYELYSVIEWFTETQIKAPSSIRLSVPKVFQERFGLNDARFYEFGRAGINQAYFQLFTDDYNIGFQDGANLLDGIGTIAAAPVNGLATILDFDIFGVNVKAVVIGVIAVLVALLAWKIIKHFIPV